ncbi:Ornithine carbamoyltransferase, mitochondrial [Zancudomyces culisetae]|uniref:ornithine carbamoyltransferase n=1 Tax=Zancudomyces culisetae TaxID=1213189 RepID=A0A1R1PSM7_ZANCU|nr:Ornithine carbamoyltransferase, mitochondrial [Zancudomyces culisetae]|eukprot:OMH83929.1 Ornithine carbamoyltransferase, mitochondrial [Zancudomyces culisetae]
MLKQVLLSAKGSTLLFPKIFVPKIQSRVYHRYNLEKNIESRSNLRHFLTLQEYSGEEIINLVDNSAKLKATHPKNPRILEGKTIAMMFSKRSTRTRVATETAMANLGGSSLFLGKDDIQLGVNESLKDTSIVVSSMADCIMARVNGHKDIVEFAKYSSVPVINALSDRFHPTQILADLLTIKEHFGGSSKNVADTKNLFNGMVFSWVGDSNNILYEMMVSLPKLGISLNISTPKAHPVPKDILEYANQSKLNKDTKITLCGSPTEAIHSSNVIVTDTWISMGMEGEKKQRLKDFEGYKITMDMINKAGPRENWVFMHCLPRKQEEVDDEVFYSKKHSLVFQEAENRKWTIMSVLQYLLSSKNQ